MSVLDTAYSLLATRARSATELTERLRRKGFADDAVAACIAELLEKGYLDDAAFAESFVRDRIRLRPKGRRALETELRAKGVAAETARRAIERAWAEEEVDESALALKAARAWVRRAGGARPARRSDEERLRFMRRLQAHLGRRGFTMDAVRVAVEDVLS